MRFITNTVWRDCAKINSNDLTRVTGDVQSLTGGPIFIGYKTTHDNGSDDNHWIYQKNDSYTLTADTCVIAGNANTLAWASGYKLQYLDYSTGWTTITPNETSGATWDASTDSSILCGPESDCFCFTFTKLTDASAYRISVQSMDATEYASEFQKWYMSESFSFSSGHVSGIKIVNQRRVNIRDSVHYVCDKAALITVDNVTRADLNNFHSQYKVLEQPFFIYDSAAQYIPGKLWHVIMTQPPEVQAVDDDIFRAVFYISRLRHYGSYY